MLKGMRGLWDMEAAEIVMRYREYAANCLRVARETSDPQTKRSLVDMAQVWVTLAEQTEKDRQSNCDNAVERPIPEQQQPPNILS
jgi:hypothetical protein